MRGKDLITAWEEGQPPEVREEFRRFVRANYHNKPAIQNWLDEHGLEIKAKATIYKWVNSNVPPGDQAILFNAECQDYIGINIIPAMEKILAQMVRISQVYIDKIENSDLSQIPLDKAIDALPNYAREVRAVAEQVERVSRGRDISTLALDGAARVYELMMNAPGIRDTSIEEFIRKSLEASIAQLQDEIEKTPVK